MKKIHQDNSTKTLAISLLVVLGFLILAFSTIVSINGSNKLSQNDQVFAGSQETVDLTAIPSSIVFSTQPPTTSQPSATFKTFPSASTKATASATTFATPTPLPTLIPAISPTPFDFFSSVSSPTPEITIPPFDLQLPDEQESTTNPTPSPTPVATVSGMNNQTIIIGVVIGVVVLILLIVGVILLRRSKDNTPPPMMPQANAGLDPNQLPPTPPNGPQYPPYINQQ